MFNIVNLDFATESPLCVSIETLFHKTFHMVQLYTAIPISSF